MLSKQELRKLINQIISKKTSQEIENESSKIRDLLDLTLRDRVHKVLPLGLMRIMAYYPLNDEVDITLSLESWCRTGCRGISLTLPRMVKNRIKAFNIVNLEKDLVLSKRWGLEQGGIKIPAKTCIPIDPQSIDAIIIPGRAFDKEGNRVGRGKGHYDRFLPLLRPDAIKIGICFHNQLFGSVPAEEHDIQLNYVITNKDVYTCAEWRQNHNKDETL